MKKVLALVMVLSMVGFASAALQIDAAGGKAIVVGQLEKDMYLILSAGNGASLSGFALGKDAPLASINEMQGTAGDFAAAGAPIPAGFEGQAWFLASFPGEAYKNGEMLTAGLALTTSQSTRTWTEVIDCTQVPNGTLTRTWTEVTDFVKGAVSLASYDLDGNVARLADKSFDSQTVSSLTFVDGPCVPEPLTLSLLGLGALVLRRRS